MSILRTVAGLASLAASVTAHGYVSGIVADGTYYEGTSPSWTYAATKPDTPGWYANNQDNGFVPPSSFADGDIVCHKGATVGGAPVPVTAGSKVDLQWNTWPESHHGPVLDYLAPVSGESFADVDKTALSFFKIGEGGLIDGSSAPGSWASDELMANNNTWTVTIPESIAPGNYVLRHEIIALHSAGQEDGAQNYPQCINIEVSGSGTASPEGVAATALYKKDDAGILVNIYTTGYDYQIPGPTLWDGASSGATETGAAPSGTAAASSSAAATSAPAVTSAPATTSSAVQKPQEPQQTADPSFYSGGSDSSPSTTADAGATTSSTTLYATATTAATVTGEAPYSAIETLASAIPSEALTSTLPAYSAAPSPTGGYMNGTQWGNLPSKPLPEGWCLKDLLQWVAYLLKQSWTKGDRRHHARDFNGETDAQLFKSFAKAML